MKLKQHIQQMADEFAKKDGVEKFTKHDYTAGFKDADAVGFAEWISSNSYPMVSSWRK